MTFKDMVRWNTRVSAMYALGIWTMIGSFAYFKYTVKKEEVQEQEDPNQVVHRTPHNETVIIYKKDFVPYSSRIYTFIRSFSSDPGTGDNEK
uniref:Small integral membrane protein 26 n=1 Tax=Lates calcarifer TaxID=8187 RepID=A0A4W6BS02_LATCA